MAKSLAQIPGLDSKSNVGANLLLLIFPIIALMKVETAFVMEMSFSEERMINQEKFKISFKCLKTSSRSTR